MLTKTDNTAEIGMHVFERAGLGKGPFRCIGFSELVITHPDGSTQAGGSCDFCFTGIRFAAHIRSADGKTFKVGSDCVARTGDAGLIKGFKTHPQVRALNRAKAKGKDERNIAEWKSLIDLPATVEKLSAVMVPGRPWVAGEQITRYENIKRIWGMCGATGRARTLKALKGFVAEEAKVS